MSTRRIGATGWPRRAWTPTAETRARRRRTRQGGVLGTLDAADAGVDPAEPAVGARRVSLACELKVEAWFLDPEGYGPSLAVAHDSEVSVWDLVRTAFRFSRRSVIAWSA